MTKPAKPPGKTPGSITITPTDAELTEGSTQQLTATVRNINGSVMSGVNPSGYSSTSDSVTVDGSGLALAVTEGSAAIRATLGPLMSNPCNVVVTAPVVVTPPPNGTNFAKSDFSSGVYDPPFWNPWGRAIDVVDGELRIHYSVNAVTQFDDNKAILPRGLTRTFGDSLWFKAGFRLPADARMQDTNPGLVQRKLWRFGFPGISGTITHPYEIVMTSFGSVMAIANTPAQPFTIALGTGNLYYIPSHPPFTAGMRHGFEVQIKINSAMAVADGILRVWFDDVLIFDRTDMQWSSAEWTDFDPVNYVWTDFGVGQQADAEDSTPLEEDRFWDDISFADTKPAL